MCQLLTYKVAGETNPNNSRIIGKSKIFEETSQLEPKNGVPGGPKPFQKAISLVQRGKKIMFFFLYLQKLFYYHHYHQKKQNEITIIFTEKITECTYR